MEGPILVLTVRNPQMLWLQKEIWLSRKQRIDRIDCKKYTTKLANECQ